MKDIALVRVAIGRIGKKKDASYKKYTISLKKKGINICAILKMNLNLTIVMKHSV